MLGPRWYGHIFSLRWIYPPTLTRQACRIWRADRADAAQHAPIRSGVPTLVLNGDWEGMVWPAGGAHIVRTLRHAYRFVLPGLGNDTLFQSGCPAEIVAAFLDTPAARPAAGCIAGTAPPDFTPSGGGYAGPGRRAGPTAVTPG